MDIILVHKGIPPEILQTLPPPAGDVGGRYIYTPEKGTSAIVHVVMTKALGDSCMN